MPSLEIMLLYAVAFAALTYFFVSTCYLLYGRVPYMLWYWYPDEAGHIELPEDLTGFLLPSETTASTSSDLSSTLARFRLDEGFPLVDAVKEYDLNPFDYVATLEKIAKEIGAAAYQSDPAGYSTFLAQNRLKKQKRYDIGDSKEGEWTYMTFRDYKLPGQTARILSFNHWVKLVYQRVQNVFGREIAMVPEQRIEKKWTGWMKEYVTFQKNLTHLCQRIGSQFGEYSTPEANIFWLRQYASEGKQRVSPLYEQISKLGKQLDGYRRINAALQVRQTIEKLVGAIHLVPDRTRYLDTTRGPMWKQLWSDILEEYDSNPHNDINPFHGLLQSAGNSAHLREDIVRKASNLYNEMSGEIHNYEKRISSENAAEGQDSDDAFDFPNFDETTRAITRVLRPKKYKLEEPWEVNWAAEVDRYPFDLHAPSAKKVKKMFSQQVVDDAYRRGEEQGYYEGYEDCKQGRPKRKFTEDLSCDGESMLAGLPQNEANLEGTPPSGENLSPPLAAGEPNARGLGGDHNSGGDLGPPTVEEQ